MRWGLLDGSASSFKRRLIQIEEELGSLMFLRQKSGMRPTAARDAVLANARRTLHDADRMTNRPEELRGTRGATVRISPMRRLTEGLLPRVLAAFREYHAAVSVTVRARLLSDAETDRGSGEADLGLA